MEKDIRWKQRFENFERAFTLLKSSFDEKPYENLSDLEKEGIVQRFEYTYELAWKTLKDYLEYEGVAIEKVTPRAVIKQAFAFNIIEDGQIWIDMVEHRNDMSHTYNKKTFDEVMDAISNNYLTAIEQVYLFLGKEVEK